MHFTFSYVKMNSCRTGTPEKAFENLFSLKNRFSFSLIFRHGSFTPFPGLLFHASFIPGVKHDDEDQDNAFNDILISGIHMKLQDAIVGSLP